MKTSIININYNWNKAIQNSNKGDGADFDIIKKKKEGELSILKFFLFYSYFFMRSGIDESVYIFCKGI